MSTLSKGESRIKRKGPKVKNPKGSSEHKIERRNFLSQLVHEFQASNSKAARLQVLANLANFCYDPYNRYFVKDLGVIPILIQQLGSKQSEFITYAMAGLCNCSADSLLRCEIVNRGGLEAMLTHIHDVDVSTVTSLITALVFLMADISARPVIRTEDMRHSLEQLVSHSDKRIVNLSKLFLLDYYGVQT